MTCVLHTGRIYVIVNVRKESNCMKKLSKSNLDILLGLSTAIGILTAVIAALIACFKANFLFGLFVLGVIITVISLFSIQLRDYDKDGKKITL